MRITLAGYNIDAEVIDLFRAIIDAQNRGVESVEVNNALERLVGEPLTPETISAAYARISRSEKGVRELRLDARSSVSRARQSNERIVFGLGHASVAEHAVFNIDVTDASRLALEELEAHRLVSYTEASQRYISMSGDFVVPYEIENGGQRKRFESLCSYLFEGYRKLTDALVLHHVDLPEKERIGRAREDARYLLPLACRGQVGMTVNARNAEWIIQQSNHSHLAEVREMGRQMQSVLRSLTPSLIKYTEATPLWMESAADVSQEFALKATASNQVDDEVTLLSAPAHAENLVVTALGLKTDSVSIRDAAAMAEKMGANGRADLLHRAHSYLTEHTPVRREMELATFAFGLVLSASAFAQLKRHRISTLISQTYDPSLGVTVPTAILDAGLEEDFRLYTDKASAVFSDLKQSLGLEQRSAAQYALTNAHRRRVIFQANAREMMHLSRLREDSHAQWDIRNLAGKMVSLAREVCPSLMSFAAGKDRFGDMKSRFGVSK